MLRSQLQPEDSDGGIHLVHVVISLIAIGAGIVVLAGLLGRKRVDQVTALFLVTTAATSLTGFGFPFVQLLPSDIGATVCDHSVDRAGDIYLGFRAVVRFRETAGAPAQRFL